MMCENLIFIIIYNESTAPILPKADPRPEKKGRGRSGGFYRIYQYL